MVHVTNDDLNYVRNPNRDIWSSGNAVLYRLCEESPTHDDLGIVVAKTWLIGRSYGAMVERNRGRMSGVSYTLDAFYEDQLAPVLMKSEIDSRLEFLKGMQPDSDEAIQVGVELHRYMVELLHELTNRSHRSFVSKYLHFHAPQYVYIYDSIAARGLSVLRSRKRGTRGFGSYVDSTYALFVARVLDLRDELLSGHMIVLTPRQMDRLLLKYGSEHP